MPLEFGARYAKFVSAMLQPQYLNLYFLQGNIVSAKLQPQGSSCCYNSHKLWCCLLHSIVAFRAHWHLLDIILGGFLTSLSDLVGSVTSDLVKLQFSLSNFGCNSNGFVSALASASWPQPIECQTRCQSDEEDQNMRCSPGVHGIVFYRAPGCGG